MKHLSIKLKITLWYTVFMTLLIVAVLWLLLSVSSQRMLSSARTLLKDTVLRSYQEIEYQDGILIFDDDINYLGEGIYLTVYDSTGSLLYGRIPAGFSGASTLIMDELQQVENGTDRWYVYDYCRQLEGYGNLWIRGITSQSGQDAAVRIMLRIFLVLLPLSVLLIGAGGYGIIRRALKPLSDMTQAAGSISEGSDLSRRITPGPGEDEVHRLARTFDRMMERLQNAFENERRFTSDVSHELRTPVSVILSQCEFASREDATEEEQAQALAAVAAQARQMSALISQLLTLSRMDSGRHQPNRERINLSELAEITLEELREQAAAAGITLEGQFEAGLFAEADETMMMRLFINLLTNSIQYGKEGGHTLFTLKKEAGEIVGTVADDGIGIRKEQLDKIWLRFYQADPARSQDRQGSSGLGLPMVKGIVQAHGGTIGVTSTPGKGSSFTFRLPL